MTTFNIPLTESISSEEELLNSQVVPETFRLYLTDEVTPEIATSLVEQFYKVEEINTQLVDTVIPITLIINSPGGDLPSAVMICAVMNEIETPVHCKCLGQACSAAFMIFMNGEYGHRYTCSSAQFMSHRLSTSIAGSHSELKYHGAEMDRLHNRIVNHYIKCTGLPKKIINEELLTGHDVWLSAAECIKYKVVDKILNLESKHATKQRRNERSGTKKRR